MHFYLHLKYLDMRKINTEHSPILYIYMFWTRRVYCLYSWWSSHSQLRKSVPCHQKELSCGLPCSVNLPCGRHRCILPCHKGPCLKEGQSCTQPCTVPRSLCGHNCAAPCHDGACPDTLCKEMVCGVSSTVHCSYRLTLYTVHYFLLRLLS